MSTTLYRKYRPQAWADIAGQNHVKVTLAFEVETGKIAHAYLFSGPRGVGKTTVARILAKAINCLDRKGAEPCGKCQNCQTVAEGKSLDIIEIDAASHRGIDAVRENIIENARFSPSRLKYKVFIIDEVHMLTTEAFNALLKTLEEPPAQTVFILATTELHKVPPTIVSRCQRFDFRKIPFTDLVERLHGIAEREGIKVDAKTLEEIARNSDGSLRDAEGLLGKVLAVSDGKRVSYDQALVVLPRSDFAAVSSFVESLIRRDGRSALMSVDECLENGADIDQFASDSVELLRKLLLAKVSGNPDALAVDMDEEQKKRLTDLRALIEAPRLVSMIELMLEKRREIKICQPPQLPLELAVARLCAEEETWQPSAAKPPAPAPAAPLKPFRKIADAAKPAPLKSEAVPAADAPAEAVVCECSVTVDQVKSVWGEFMRLAGEENHSLPFLLGVAEPIEVKGALIKIGFNYPFHRDKFNNEKNRRALEKVLSGLLMTEVRVEGMILERKVEIVDNGPAMAVAAPAPALTAVDSLAAAFGGKVVQ